MYDREESLFEFFNRRDTIQYKKLGAVATLGGAVAIKNIEITPRSTNFYFITTCMVRVHARTMYLLEQLIKKSGTNQKIVHSVTSFHTSLSRERKKQG